MAPAQVRRLRARRRRGAHDHRAAGQSQTFTQAQLEAWEGLTAIFNGSAVTVTLMPGESAPGEQDEISATIEEVVIGLPARRGGRGGAAPQWLRDLLGTDMGPLHAGRSAARARKGLRGRPRRSAEQSMTACRRDDPLSGRIMPIGCTGWIIQGGALLTAGHCIGALDPDRRVQRAAPRRPTARRSRRREYATSTGWIGSSIVERNTGIGNDWAMFKVLPNTQTGQSRSPRRAGHTRSRTRRIPSNVRITGYGVDGPRRASAIRPAQCREPDPADPSRCAHGETRSAGRTRRPCATPPIPRADSGSPVIVEGGGNLAIGIHTNGGLHGDQVATTQGRTSATRGSGPWPAMSVSANPSR